MLNPLERRPSQMKRDKRKKIVTTIALNGMLTAICTIATLIIQIPIGFNGGYSNIGDSIIIMSALLFGPLTGFIVGGVGSGIADLFGFASFAPFTFVVKGLEGFIIGLVFLLFKKKKVFGSIFSSIIGLLVMVFGYFLTDLILGFGFQASLLGTVPNFIQAGCSLLIGLILTFAMGKVKIVKNIQDI